MTKLSQIQRTAARYAAIPPEFDADELLRAINGMFVEQGVPAPFFQSISDLKAAMRNPEEFPNQKLVKITVELVETTE